MLLHVIGKRSNTSKHFLKIFDTDNNMYIILHRSKLNISAEVRDFCFAIFPEHATLVKHDSARLRAFDTVLFLRVSTSLQKNFHNVLR